MANLNPLKNVWDQGRTAFGMWASMPVTFGAEILAKAGVDYVCVDQQHGLIDYSSAVPMFQAVESGGAVPITRVLQNDPGLIGKALDAGAHGVIVPLVSSTEEAARAVAACRYPPQGVRSYGPTRAGGVIGSTDPEDLGGEVLCFAMVETQEGVENLDEIAATPGLDGIYIGPSDLALALGLTPTLEVREGIHAEVVERIRKACEERGIIAGVHSPDGTWANKHARDGFRMVTVAADAVLLRGAVRREVDAARGENQ